MNFHKIVLLAFGVFIFTLSAELENAESQFSNNDETETVNTNKKWAVIDGFRSAKFDMNEKQVLRAIARDFKIAKSKVKRKTHAANKTIVLKIEVDNLMPIGGTAHIGYILGYKSKRLMHINIVWGIGLTKEKDTREVVTLSNILRAHFNKKRYQKKNFISYGQLTSTHKIPFRGQDKKGRTIVMHLLFPKNMDGKGGNPVNNRILKISYVENMDEPDLFDFKKGKF